MPSSARLVRRSCPHTVLLHPHLTSSSIHQQLALCRQAAASRPRHNCNRQLRMPPHRLLGVGMNLSVIMGAPCHSESSCAHTMALSVIQLYWLFCELVKLPACPRHILQCSSC